jgi:hypothetical protein
LFYGLINYEGVKAVLYEGGHDGEYLPTETRDDCDCVAHLEFWEWQDGEIAHYVGGGTPNVLSHPSEPEFPEGPSEGRVEWHNEVGCNADTWAEMFVCYRIPPESNKQTVTQLLFDCSFDFQELERDPCDHLTLFDFEYRLNSSSSTDCATPGGDYVALATAVSVPEFFTGLKEYQVDVEPAGWTNRQSVTIQVRAISEGHSDDDMIITIDNVQIVSTDT